MTLLNRKRHDSGRHYVEYQAEITRKHLLPLFRRLKVPTDRILDVGCGKGGCAIALAQALSTTVHGFDIKENDIKVAREAATEFGVKAKFDVVNVVTDPLPDDRFGLVLMRDVVEHLPDIQKALSRLRNMLDAEGVLYITFPPWLGPYAGH